ncbi:hypothetical protein [Methylobacterium sp. ID0610]|uniref:hypothetical protein n=1 Tax=Methylobacterium carpenticola TaxID=3344827 RepID=UPI0036CAB142
MTNFAKTERNRFYPRYLDIDTFAHPVDHGVVEMQPRWIDDTTLQLAVSIGYSTQEVYHQRCVSLKKSCPGLAEALKWCAQRRMGAKTVMVRDPDAPSPETREWLDAHDEDGRVGSPWYKTYSHRLVFKNPNHAFEFKMSWL